MADEKETQREEDARVREFDTDRWPINGLVKSILTLLDILKYHLDGPVVDGITEKEFKLLETLHQVRPTVVDLLIEMKRLPSTDTPE